tara:strand:- start:296 stop:466 length:171 start_codon:yes stop_codon:yes gene_type:complete
MTSFDIKLYCFKTKTYETLASIIAETKEEARSIFVRENNFKPKDGYHLFIKTPACL